MTTARQIEWAKTLGAENRARNIAQFEDEQSMLPSFRRWLQASVITEAAMLFIRYDERHWRRTSGLDERAPRPPRVKWRRAYEGWQP